MLLGIGRWDPSWALQVTCGSAELLTSSWSPGAGGLPAGGRHNCCSSTSTCNQLVHQQAWYFYLCDCRLAHMCMHTREHRSR
jgi:hypothetical protein